MKTYVTNDYQVTLRDNGGVRVLIEGNTANTHIIYDPEGSPRWSKHEVGYSFRGSNNITDIELPKWQLEILRDALALVNKQDLFDDEIVFVNDEEK